MNSVEELLLVDQTVDFTGSEIDALVTSSLYDAFADALIEAQADDGVAVVVVTGEGRAFCAGTDLLEMASRMSDPDFVPGRHGFPGMIDHLIAFDKPVVNVRYELDAASSRRLGQLLVQRGLA